MLVQLLVVMLLQEEVELLAHLNVDVVHVVDVVDDVVYHNHPSYLDHVISFRPYDVHEDSNYLAY